MPYSGVTVKFRYSLDVRMRVAPVIDLVFVDPAAIVLPDQKNLFVESTDTFLQDCGFCKSSGNVSANLGFRVFTSFEKVAVVNGDVSIVKQKQKVNAVTLIYIRANNILGV
ncbi:uncharacterized protein F4812DRAFT_50505 [Daldinia caldariorum]|uniref:uncharacterized protein n=1 Tax=Daldinia caldariorum TaxID=326644 RepID=UPI002007235D|nr:uncharacterized protein F4812DRAFT_50505 [Daldinia caldariorum]KAI1467135.1 hypothetical protein F4812DRAFT_50505 [Daldinia caldariorum]